MLYAALAMVMGLAHLPLLFVHAQRLWWRPHYQCFPFMLAGAFLLGWRAWPRIDGGATRPLPGLAAIVAVGAWLILLAAVILSFSWLAMLATLMLLTAGCLAWGGIDYLRRFWPAGLMLVLLLHPPTSLEQPVILNMQRLATRASSPVLDALQVPHLVLGNVIETAHRRLLIEEACSGIDSLVAVVVSTLFLLFWLHRTWLHSLLLLVGAVGWVLLANVLRIVMVAFLDVHWHLDISAGWRHDLVGVLLFAVALGLTASTDQLLRFVLGMRTVVPKVRTSVSRQSPSLTHAWRQGYTEAALGVGYGILLTVQVAWPPVTGTELGGPRNELEVPALGRAALPPQWGGWQIAGFESTLLKHASPSQTHSQVWHYRSPRGRAEVCLDYPFQGWHNLQVCYLVKGCTLESQRDSTDSEGYQTKEFGFRRSLGRTSFLLYQMFDENGEPVSTGLSQRFEQALSRWGTRRTRSSATFEVQLYIECDERLTPNELDEARAFFSKSAVELRRAVKRAQSAQIAKAEAHRHD
jgi:exosortase